MVRIIESRVIANDKSYVNIACLSTDSKPVGNYVTGSVLLEADTGAQFAYNESANEWNQISAGYTPETTAQTSEE